MCLNISIHISGNLKAPYQCQGIQRACAAIGPIRMFVFYRQSAARRMHERLKATLIEPKPQCMDN